MVSFRPEGLKNPKGAECSAPLSFTTEYTGYTEHTEEISFRTKRARSAIVQRPRSPATQRKEYRGNATHFHPFPGGPKGHERLLSLILLFFEQETRMAFRISHSIPCVCPPIWSSFRVRMEDGGFAFPGWLRDPGLRYGIFGIHSPLATDRRNLWPRVPFLVPTSRPPNRPTGERANRLTANWPSG